MGGGCRGKRVRICVREKGVKEGRVKERRLRIGVGER